MIIYESRQPRLATHEWQRNLRRSARVKTNFQITIRFAKNGESIAVPGYARNICGEGIGAFIPADLEIDQKLELQFTLPGSNRELMVRGIVRAVEEFHYGIEFMELDANSRRLLRAFATP
jgi:PilZ domain